MEFQEPPKQTNISVNEKINELQPKKTYFYEMPNGKIEAVEENEAWELYRKNYKQVGVSDGRLFALAVQEGRALFKEQGVQAMQDRIRKGFEEELESAKGHLETPPNKDMFGNGSGHLKQVLGRFK